MKLNHINIAVKDVVTTKEFLEKYFGLKCIASAGNMFAALNDDDGLLFNLIKDENASYPDTFHIGFPQEDEESVDRIYETLKEDGFEVWEPALAHGSYTFYFKSPGEFTIEIYAQAEEKTKTVVHPYFDDFSNKDK